MKFDALR